jgi:hypothetical protein
MIDRTFEQPPVVTFDDLWRVHDLITERFPHDYLDDGLGAIGLFLHRTPANAGYPSTPKNSVTFASLGVDGIHIGSLTPGTEVDPTAPVVLTTPMEFDAPNRIVGRTLHDFLCLGCRRGYTYLANLAIHPDATADYFSQPPTEFFDDRAPAILDLVRAEWSLSPWSDVRRHLDELDQEFGSRRGAS